MIGNRIKRLLEQAYASTYQLNKLQGKRDGYERNLSDELLQRVLDGYRSADRGLLLVTLETLMLIPTDLFWVSKCGNCLKMDRYITHKKKFYESTYRSRSHVRHMKNAVVQGGVSFVGDDCVQFEESGAEGDVACKYTLRIEVKYMGEFLRYFRKPVIAYLNQARGPKSRHARRRPCRMYLPSVGLDGQPWEYRGLKKPLIEERPSLV